MRNGIAMSAANWNPVCAALGTGHRVLLHDFKGQLLSGKPASGYSLAAHADDLAARASNASPARRSSS